MIEGVVLRSGICCDEDHVGLAAYPNTSLYHTEASADTHMS